MADVVCNIAKGRVAQWAQNVEDNSPAAAVLRVFIFTAGVDNDYLDADTISALAAGTPNEVTNTNYANKSLDETQITITVDDTNDRCDVDINDQTWTSVSAGDSWTKLVVAYDDDGTDTDTNTVPMTAHDFSVTPDGSDITAQIAAAGFFRAS